jgi:hypothetical protein
MGIVEKIKWKWQKKIGGKNHFIFEWGAYAYNIMSFGLCNALITFQKTITQTLKEYFNDFMQVFLNDFNVYGNKEKHLTHLKKCMI